MCYRPNDISAVGRHCRPAGVHIGTLDHTECLIQILGQTIGQLQSVPGLALILRKNQTALCLAGPVASGRYDQTIGILRRKVCIDAGDIAIAVLIGKGILTGLLQIGKCEAAQISHDIDDLHLSFGQPVYIQMYRLLDAVAPVRETAHIAFQILTEKYSGTGIEPAGIVVKGIDLDIAEPMDQGMSPIAPRPHIGCPKLQLALDQIIEHLTPALTVVKGEEHAVPVIFDNGGGSKHSRRLRGSTDARETILQHLSLPDILLSDAGDSGSTSRGDLPIQALRHLFSRDPSQKFQRISDDMSVDIVPGVTAVPGFQYIGIASGGGKGHVQILLIHAPSLCHLTVVFAADHQPVLRFRQRQEGVAPILG